MRSVTLFLYLHLEYGNLERKLCQILNLPTVDSQLSKLLEIETTYQIQEGSYNFEGNDKITKISYKILMAILL